MNLTAFFRSLLTRGAGTVLLILVLCGLVGWGGFEWLVNRIYVPQGYSLLLRYKGPPLPFLPGSRPAVPAGRLARVDENGDPLETGVLERMAGPGRHFYCPWWWERELVPDVIVEPGSVGLVTSLMGEDRPDDDYLVDGDLGQTRYKGLLRKTFAPGRYRINRYAYSFEKVQLVSLRSNNQVKNAGWVEIPTGYVGVVTNLTGNPLTGALPGIQAKVLQPGNYPINPKEQQVDIVKVGYREKSIVADVRTDENGHLVLDESGEPVVADDDSGISFPSNDGFNIHMDFTAIWGITPEQAPNVIRQFGNVDQIESKVVVPQIESICRNMGSTLGAVELLVGTSRQKFQFDTSENFKKVLQEKNITLLYGLVRHIYIPREVRLPIQEAFIADELKLTLEQQQQTKRTEALLKEATARVELESGRVRAETEKLVAETLAMGSKTSAETRAETVRLQAAIDKTTAALEAQATILVGEATSQAKKLSEQAKAEKFQLAVDAFGSGDAYNQWVFASGLPDDIKLNLLYAGQGTFWTDLKGFTEVMLGRQAQQGAAAGEASGPQATPVVPAGTQPPVTPVRRPAVNRPAR